MHVQAVFIPFIFVRMEEKGKILIIDDNKDVLVRIELTVGAVYAKGEGNDTTGTHRVFHANVPTGRGLAGYEFPSGCRERAGGF